MSDDPYATLGVKKSASDDEIRKAYRKIARTSHPDLNPDDAGAEARFKAASGAYDLLKDAETRARFDRGEIDASGAERPQRPFYRDYAGRGETPFGGGGFRDAAEEGFDDPSDIFAEFLRQRAGGGGGGGGGGWQGGGFRARGPDARYALEVPFLDAARGARTRIVLPGGDALEVTIPKGTADGQTLRLRGKGGPGIGGGPDGDALVTVAVAAHPVFRRDGDDIVLTLPVTLDEAVLGGKVPVPTIDGPVSLTVPRGSSGGAVLRLRGRGIARRDGGRGDQRVELRVAMPPRIDDELAAFLEGWRKTHGYDPRKGMTA